MNTTNLDSVPPCTFIPLASYDWKEISPLSHPCYGIGLPWNPIVYCLVTAFYSITIWTALGLLLQVLYTFKRWNNMYFW
jgi:hypothetical protein